MNYTTLATQESIERTSANLRERGFMPHMVQNKEEALLKIKELIPPGASVMNGASRTLEQIGYIDHLKSGAHGWKNVHEEILKEKDAVKQTQMRKEAVLSDFYLGSVHALSEDGQIVIASNSGSQLPHVVFTSPNIIFVVSTKKITPNLEEALNRLESHVFPLEDERMKSVGMGGSAISKLVILKQEPSFSGRKVHVLLVTEDLGF